MNNAVETHFEEFTSNDTFLAIDDTVFSVQQNVSKCLCEANKNNQNPIITNTPNGPDACRAHVLGACFFDGKYQMWYLANDSKGRWYTCYAESLDGYNWLKPELGLIDYNGSNNNNIIIHESDGDFTLTNIYLDTEESDPARRYKAPVYGNITQDYFTSQEDRDRYPGGSHPCIKTFAYSADGIHWTYDETIDFPLRRKIESGALFKKDDTWFMVHQMIRGEYSQVHPGSRYLAVSYSKDFKHWKFANEPGFNFSREYGRIIQTHVTPALHEYGNVTLGIAGIFYYHPELYKQETDLFLILTNDGFHWRQPIAENPFATILRRGDTGQWDNSFLVQGGLVNTPNKTFIYYSASNKLGNLGYINRQVGMAELPRDRFGYLTPSVGWGYRTSEKTQAVLISKPILIKEKGLSLYLNVQGARRGCDSITVGLLDENNESMSGYSIKDCDNITDDKVDVMVTWGNKIHLDSFIGCRIRLKIELIGKNPQHEILACTEYPKLFGFRFSVPLNE